MRVIDWKLHPHEAERFSAYLQRCGMEHCDDGAWRPGPSGIVTTFTPVGLGEAHAAEFVALHISDNAL